MASDHPDDAHHPDEPRTPRGSHTRPESLPIGDWLAPEETIDFDSLQAPSDPGAMSMAGLVPLDEQPAVPDDGEPPSSVDLIPLEPIPAAPVAELPSDMADALADLPPAEPASGWLQSGVNLGHPPGGTPDPVPPPTAAEASDIFTGTAAGESDVIRSLTDVPVGESDVLQATAGSSRFEVPGDATDDGTSPPSGVLRTRSVQFPNADAAEQAAWEALNDDTTDASPAAAAPDDLGQLDFNQLDPHASGSSVFADVGGEGESVGESGVNLLDPDQDPADLVYTGAGSSIFDGVAPAGNEPRDAGPASEDAAGGAAVELFDTEMGGGHSAVFRGPAAGDTTVPDADDLLDPDAADDVALGGADVPDLPAAAEANPPDAAGWEDVDQATVINVPVGGLASIDLGPEPDEEIFWAHEPTSDDALGQAGGTANLQGLTSVAPVTQPAVAAPRSATQKPQKPLPLDGPSDEEESPAPRTRPAPTKRSSAGWVGGGLVGLAAGVGACAAAYFGGLVPEKTTTTSPTTAAVSRVPATTPVPAAAPLADGHALLAAGAPARALKAFEAAGDAHAPVVRAARGQARWQARVQELATTNTAVQADDPQLKQAAADLEAVLKDPAALTTAEQKRAGAQAALHLGLLKELTGDIEGAIRVYQDAARQFPESRQVFATAQHRLLITKPAGKAAQLTPRAVHELSQASVLALVLVVGQAGETPAMPDEPGFLFWEAINHATAGDFTQASAAIAKAKALHDRRRLALIGRGLNPQSDPLEQIFLRTCDDLRDYWALRAELYGHPTFGPLARKGGVSQGLAALTALQKTAADLSARVAAVTKEATAAKAAVVTLEKDRDAAAAELAVVEKKLTDATAAKHAAVKTAADRAKELAAARTRTDDTAKKLKAAEAAVDAVVKELKAVKLVDPSDDTAAVLTKLPAVAKRAAAAANSADAKRAAEALAAVQKNLDAARAEATKAKADLTNATAAADKARSDAEKAVAAAKAEADKMVTAAKTDADRMVTAAKAETKDALVKLDAEVRKATAAAQMAAQKRLDELAAALQAAQVEASAQKAAADTKLAEARAGLDARLAAKDEQHRKELAAARAGAEVPLTSSAVAAKDHAARLFTAGVDLFFRGQYAESEARLEAATRAVEGDARYWYFLGLARLAQGRAGATAFEAGAKWEAQNMPPARVVEASLERVHAAARRELNKYRP